MVKRIDFTKVNPRLQLMWWLAHRKRYIRNNNSWAPTLRKIHDHLQDKDRKRTKYDPTINPDNIPSHPIIDVIDINDTPGVDNERTNNAIDNAIDNYEPSIHREPGAPKESLGGDDKIDLDVIIDEGNERIQDILKPPEPEIPDKRETMPGGPVDGHGSLYDAKEALNRQGQGKTDNYNPGASVIHPHYDTSGVPTRSLFPFDPEKGYLHFNLQYSNDADLTIEDMLFIRSMGTKALKSIFPKLNQMQVEAMEDLRAYLQRSGTRTGIQFRTWLTRNSMNLSGEIANGYIGNVTETKLLTVTSLNDIANVADSLKAWQESVRLGMITASAADIQHASRLFDLCQRRREQFIAERDRVMREAIPPAEGEEEKTQTVPDEERMQGVPGEAEEKFNKSKQRAGFQKDADMESALNRRDASLKDAKANKLAQQRELANLDKETQEALMQAGIKPAEKRSLEELVKAAMGKLKDTKAAKLAINEARIKAENSTARGIMENRNREAAVRHRNNAYELEENLDTEEFHYGAREEATSFEISEMTDEQIFRAHKAFFWDRDKSIVKDTLRMRADNPFKVSFANLEAEIAARKESGDWNPDRERPAGEFMDEGREAAMPDSNLTQEEASLQRESELNARMQAQNEADVKEIREAGAAAQAEAEKFEADRVYSAQKAKADLSRAQQASDFEAQDKARDDFLNRENSRINSEFMDEEMRINAQYKNEQLAADTMYESNIGDVRNELAHSQSVESRRVRGLGSEVQRGEFNVNASERMRASQYAAERRAILNRRTGAAMEAIARGGGFTAEQTAALRAEGYGEQEIRALLNELDEAMAVGAGVSATMAIVGELTDIGMGVMIAYMVADWSIQYAKDGHIVVPDFQIGNWMWEDGHPSSPSARGVLESMFGAYGKQMADGFELKDRDAEMTYEDFLESNGYTMDKSYKVLETLQGGDKSSMVEGDHMIKPTWFDRDGNIVREEDLPKIPDQDDMDDWEKYQYGIVFDHTHASIDDDFGQWLSDGFFWVLGGGTDIIKEGVFEDWRYDHFTPTYNDFLKSHGYKSETVTKTIPAQFDNPAQVVHYLKWYGPDGEEIESYDDMPKPQTFDMYHGAVQISGKTLSEEEKVDRLASAMTFGMGKGARQPTERHYGSGVIVGTEESGPID